MEAAYFGVHLWAQAVKEAGDDNVAKIRRAVRHQAFDAPEGLVRIDPETQHTSKIFRIGRITTESRFEVVYSSESPIAPIPYPNTRSKGDWDAFPAWICTSAGADNGRTRARNNLRKKLRVGNSALRLAASSDRGSSPTTSRACNWGNRRKVAGSRLSSRGTVL